ncbi:hypothetical protein [Microbulbifer sp. ZKSA002]|uniref:hypothetical protein n=1 Tax=Microbulbifer sp. ZKSA002 TaxID=3243388 RepID=UPI00403A6940
MRQLIAFFVLFYSLYIQAEQLVDLDYLPKNKEITHTLEKRPVVLVDAAHHNFHTISGRYHPFADVLKSDGYIVRSNDKKIDKANLKDIDIVVIANALSEENIENWNLPNHSAFTRKEIEALFHWVKGGGSLFLIADHMPWPKATADLAEIFGFHFQNGYVEVIGQQEQYFETSDGSLADHSILKGVKDSHKLNKVRGFMGQGFLSPPNAKPVMIFSKPSIAYMPRNSIQFNENTPEISATNWHQLST